MSAKIEGKRITDQGILTKANRAFAKNVIFGLAGFFICVFFWAKPANAASLNFSPGAGSFTAQNNFTVSVYVSTNQAMNGAEATVEFPTNKLEVIGVSKAGSIFSLWIREPTYSNVGPVGNVRFEGVRLNPGYTGAKGKIIDITFRIRDTGVANVTFGGGAVLANDGHGTNIITSFGSAAFVLKPAPSASPTLTPPSATPQPQVNAANLPLPSILHFVQDKFGKDVLFNTSEDMPKWSSNMYAKFTWKLPYNITSVATLLDENPDTDPGSATDGLINEKLYPLIKEGKHYFHIRYQLGAQKGPILHYPVFIDVTNPKSFSVEFVGSEVNYRGVYSTSNPRPRLNFFSDDDLSGLDYYSVRIGDGDWLRADELDGDPYTLPKQNPDERKDIIVRAYDKAGNFSEATAAMIIEPVVMPEITFYPKYLNYPDDQLVIEGHSAPLATVEAVFGQSQMTIIAKADEKGDWRVVGEKKLEAGAHKVAIRQILNNGAQSLYTDPIYIKVNSFWWGLIRLLPSSAWYVVIIFLVLGELAIFAHYRYRLQKYRQFAKAEMEEAKKALQANIDDLSAKLAKQNADKTLVEEFKALGEIIKKQINTSNKNT